MEIQEWAIDRVSAYENNPRMISQEAIDKVAASIERFGFQQPLVVDADGILIVGHTRWRAAQKLGYKRVPVKVASELSEDEMIAYRIADNKTGEYSKWDHELLASEFKVLDGVDFDLALTGFDPGDLEGVLDAFPNRAEPVADEMHPEREHHQEFVEEGVATVSVASGDSAAEMNRLKFGDQSVPLSDDELDGLKQLLSAYLDDFGSQHGFVRWLINAKKSSNA